MHLTYRPLLAGAAAGTLLAGLAAAGPVAAAPAGDPAATSAATSAAAPAAAPAAATAGSPYGDRTSAEERRRVDRVAAPRFTWESCFEVAECDTVQLPLDYDRPGGAKVDIAVARVKAADPARRIGTLFVNPGGPGGSGVAIAVAAPRFLSPEVLARFDVVGFDPRGIEGNGTDGVRCFPSAAAQAEAMAGMNVPFPVGAAEEKAFIASAKKLGRGCSTTGRPLSGAMSTAEAARDMDVLRRAVGDSKLTYLGFSYGTALGQYYANMFPDRVRAVAIDGVINPVSWVGTRRTAEIIQDDRLRSADGAYRALRELLTRCGRAGAEVCALAAEGDPRKLYDLVAQRLRKQPLVIEVPGGEPLTITYADFVSYTLGALYDPNGAEFIVAETLAIHLEQEGRAGADPAALARLRAAAEEPEEEFYDNGYEAYSGVACTDALHPSRAEQWPAQTAAADRRAPYFGRAWDWGTVQCARNAWSVRDEDAYFGPWNKRTSAPVLVVGNYYDPATNYDDAVSSARLLPNSRLLSSDSWGHTAYGTSACVTSAMDAYLLSVALPQRGTVCTGDAQPFQPAPAARAAVARELPPVAPRVPRR
ncbi:alpha/beta hydrolase [Spirilliplanes yamanashiensis]|uniref:Peptidase n=1 Tax=Spirilliplanes yamanashiensis TaxID=42233 RepID=A0A8J3Y9H6_9ACTN|nr:alpha/beta hydrolase [Spirilliplanes yamanashiensis]MDP9815580.1 pimeloyl-ACP methyl ester carboxylesterase [Spirilliplanes yamanashiensis]GIJ03834.1 peptidase [Spirilliplanes yamanashiensis]